jgi:hypothetical protein
MLATAAAIAVPVTAVTVPAGPAELPRQLVLEQNYPNPFNPVTTIAAAVPVESDVSLRVFDMLGREIGEVFNGRWSPGFHRVQVDAGGLSSGVYFYRLEARPLSGGPALSATKKMAVVR